jgi:hypothetical protein
MSIFHKQSGYVMEMQRNNNNTEQISDNKSTEEYPQEEYDNICQMIFCYIPDKLKQKRIEGIEKKNKKMAKLIEQQIASHEGNLQLLSLKMINFVKSYKDIQHNRTPKHEKKTHWDRILRQQKDINQTSTVISNLREFDHLRRQQETQLSQAQIFDFFASISSSMKKVIPDISAYSIKNLDKTLENLESIQDEESTETMSLISDELYRSSKDDDDTLGDQISKLYDISDEHSTNMIVLPNAPKKSIINYNDVNSNDVNSNDVSNDVNSNDVNSNDVNSNDVDKIKPLQQVLTT